MAELIHLTIISREKVWFDGEVVSVSSVNDTGKFDVLARHQNFISLVRGSLTYRLEDGSSNEVPFETGIMHVLANRVKVFLGLVGRGKEDMKNVVPEKDDQKKSAASKGLKTGF